MATIPAGYVAGSPVNGVIPLYDSTSGAIAGTMQGGVLHALDTEANKSAAYAFPNEIGVNAQSGATGQAAAPQSYLSSSGSSGGSGNMTWQDIQNQGYQANDIAAFQQHGWSPDQVMQSIRSGVAQPPSSGAAVASPQNSFGISTVTSQGGNTMLQNAAGNQIWQDGNGNYFNMDAAGNKTPVTDQQAVQMGFQSANPETNALKQMGQIDPTGEALRTSLGQSYADTLSKANTPPSAADYQSYLNTFQQVDPAEYAARQGLGTSMDSYLKSMQDQFALGSQLDPTTAKQVEQQTRLAQAGRGNVYGTPQMVEEAMASGQAGQALQQQRTQNLAAALGGQQSYLGAGLGLGDTAMSLYQQGLSNKANAQQNALSYLSSGQTPYQAGAGYLNQANANAANAAQGGPVYQPASLGAGNLGTAQQAPQYGLDVGSQAQNYFNSLNNAYGAGSAGTKNKAVGAGVGAGTGALSGAATGATIGSAYPGIGTAIGAGVGAVAGGLMGGASGYYS